MTAEELAAWMRDMGTTDCCHASKPSMPADGRAFVCLLCGKSWRFNANRGGWYEA